MSISSDVRELDEVKKEIKRLTQQLRSLRLQSKSIEMRIIEYLEQSEHPGVKFQGNAIVLEKKSKRASKKKSLREADSIRILEEYGIRNAKQVLNDILEARKGDELEINKLKIKKIK